MQNRWERQAEVIQQSTFYIKSTKWRVHLHTQVEIACISCIWLMYQNAVLYELLRVAKPSLWHEAGISRAPGTASVGMKATRPPDGLSSDEGPIHTPRSADCESVAKMSLGSNTTSNGTTTKTRMQPQPQVRIQIDQQAISNQKQHHNRLSDKRPRPTTATTTKKTHTTTTTKTKKTPPLTARGITYIYQKTITTIPIPFWSIGSDGSGCVNTGTFSGISCCTICRSWRSNSGWFLSHCGAVSVNWPLRHNSTCCNNAFQQRIPHLRSLWRYMTMRKSSALVIHCLQKAVPPQLVNRQHYWQTWFEYVYIHIYIYNIHTNAEVESKWNFAELLKRKLAN